MRNVSVRVRPADKPLPADRQLAHHLAVVALDPVAPTPAGAQAVVDRLLDVTAVAVAALGRDPVRVARGQALDHPYRPGAGLIGLGPTRRFGPEWAAWANAVAVRELDWHDTYLAADYAHPADAIAPLLAVAQHRGVDGAHLLAAILASYEIQVALTRAIDLHSHRIDHVTHLAPAVAGGLGRLLDLDVETVRQAIGQAVHTTTSTRQSRKGEITSWKAYAPAWAGKIAIEAVDRAMRGQRSPAPIYEGADGLVAWMLDGPEAEYEVLLPEAGEPHDAIGETFTKEYSAEYQAQALIDLARRLGENHPQLRDEGTISSVVIHTSDHTHRVIGTGSHDPEKYDPDAGRETLDHSIPYIFAVALQDGTWHHVDSYTPARAHRPDTIDLWRRVTTEEDPWWTERYHAADPAKRAYGARVVVTTWNGLLIEESIDVADAHPGGARPFDRARYLEKFRTLTADALSGPEVDRFCDLAAGLERLTGRQVGELTPTARPRALGAPAPEGLF